MNYRISLHVLFVLVFATYATADMNQPGSDRGDDRSPARAFLKWHADHDVLPEKKQKLIREALQTAREKQEPSATITDALSLAYPEFKKGLIQLNNENTKDAIDRFSSLAKSKDPYLAAHARLYQARTLMQENNYEEAVPLLDTVVNKQLSRVEKPGKALLDLAMCQKRSLQNEEAVNTLKKFAREYPDAPRVQKAQAKLMYREIILSKKSPFHKVERLMGYSHRRIKLNKLDDALQQMQEQITDQRKKKEERQKKTQKQQKRVVKTLNKLIEKIKKQQKAKGGGGGGGMAGGGMGGAPSGNSPGGGPASQSALVGGSGKGGPLNRVVRGKKSESWGELPPKEREKALNHLKSRYPERYRELVEQYYKSLQEEGE